MKGSGGAPDVVIVGGGIVGTAAAAFLAEAGASVVLVEREGLASGASGANSGVVQHPFDPILADLYARTLDLYRDLAARSNAFPFATRPVGLLYISPEEASARRQAALIEATFPSLGTDVIGGEDLRRVEPAAGRDLWACHVDIGYPVMPGASTYAYASMAESSGAIIRLGRSATLTVAGDAVIGVRIDGQPLAAGAVLAAAGPWTPALLDPTGRWNPIRPRWGVVVETELASPPRHVLEEAGIEAVLDTMPAGEPGLDAVELSSDAGHPGASAASDAVEFSLVPLPGASAVGSTFLPLEPDPTSWTEAILVHATRFVPALGDAPIRGARACARPQSDDGRPLIGAVPGRRNLYVCAGHGPWGISTGPASARLVADLVLGRPPMVAPELDPARFGPPSGQPRDAGGWRERMGVEPTARRRAPRHRC
jgi:D-hydroxyproline dehydrogenase subunit beta